MRSDVVFPRQVELSILQPDNLILIENQDDTVVIRAARDNFSVRAKARIIRYLSIEGYIPERYQWLGHPETESYSGLKWVIDRSWMKLDPGLQRKAARQILGLIAWASVLWLILMISVFLRAPLSP